MSNRPVYFEFHSADSETSREFFEDVFDWKVEDFPGVSDYLQATTGDDSQAGINGGIMKSRDDTPRTTVTIEVENLDAHVSTAITHGGVMVVPKTPVPGVGHVAYFIEPGGILFGLLQRDESVTASGS